MKGTKRTKSSHEIVAKRARIVKRLFQKTWESEFFVIERERERLFAWSKTVP